VKPTLLIPDCHHPAVDKNAWKLVLKVAKDIRPETIVTLGDFGDFASVMTHQKSAEQRQIRLVDEVADVEKALDQLDAVGAKTKVFVEGNHEYRVERYIADKAPDLFGVTDIPKLLDLKKRGWKFVPYRKNFKLGKINVTHDLGKAGANAHRDAMVRQHDNVVIGHTHRFAYEVRGTATGTPYLGAMFGWLGDRVAAAGYIHETASATDWALGFGVAYVRDDEMTYVQPVPIMPDYSCMVGGKLYKI
jgi:predicted phosphodiesterase